MSNQMTVRQRLRQANINYNDTFYMTYKSNPNKRVGYISTHNQALAEFDYERQDCIFSFFHEQDFKGLALAYWDSTDNKARISSNYLKDPMMEQMDPYLIQRVSSLIMNDDVEFHIVHRCDNSFGTFVVRFLFSFLMNVTHAGKVIDGPKDDYQVI